MDARTQNVVAKLAKAITELNGEIAKFGKKFKESPHYALEWSDSVFEAVARRDIYVSLHEALTTKDTKATVDSLLLHAQRSARDGARYPRRSTSSGMNLMHQCETAVWAEVSDPLWGILSDLA